MRKTAERASTRIAAKTLLLKANTLRKRKELESLVKKGQIWSAVKKLYKNKEGANVYYARQGIHPYFYPLPPRYNASKNTIHTNNRVAKKSINSAIKNKTIMDIVIPLIGKGANGAGVNPDYISNSFKNSTNMKYATVGKYRKLKAFAFVKNPTPNSRYINVIGAFPGYGSTLMNKILSNAKRNGKRFVNLKAVTNVENNKKANNYPLVKWYASKGFVRSGTLKNSTLPMRYTIR